MTEKAGGGAGIPSPAVERKGIAADGPPNGTAAPVVSTTDASPGRGKRSIPFWRFLLALLMGFVAASILLIMAAGIVLFGMDKHSFPFVDTAIIVFIPMFLAGMVSGLILEPALAGRRWEFLWLAAGSPAFPVWIIALVLLVSGVEIHPDILEVVSIGCVGAFAGSVVGALVRRGWKRWAATPRGVFWRTIGRAVSTGVVAVALCSMVFFGLVVVPVLFLTLFLEALEVADLRVGVAVLAIVLGGVAFFVGGHVSGRVMFPVLPRNPVWFFFVALANPAIVLLVLYALLFPGRVAFTGSGWFFLYLAYVIVPVLGSFTGYRVGCRKQRLRVEQAGNRRGQNRAASIPEPAGEAGHE